MWKNTHTFRVRLRHPAKFDGNHVQSNRYEFRIRGRGSVEDQAALHGVLQQIEALGLELVEVRQVDAQREPSSRESSN